MKAYLIQFDYEYYCEGYEWARGEKLLVYADSFEEACDKIKKNVMYDNVANFKNYTVE